MNYNWESLARGVHRCRLPFLDVTVGLVHGPAGVLVIDCGTTLSEAANITEDVAELTGGRVGAVVLTHHHFDHVLGSAGFPDARLYAAAPVAAALSTGVAGVRDDALPTAAIAAVLLMLFCAVCFAARGLLLKCCSEKVRDELAGRVVADRRNGAGLSVRPTDRAYHGGDARRRSTIGHGLRRDPRDHCNTSL